MAKDDCVCPEVELETVEYNPCKIGIGKIGRVFFQKVDTANNFIDGTNGMELAASWTGLPDAVDDTKVVVAPILKDVVFGESEVIEGSENFDGAPTANGVNAQQVTMIIENPTPAQVKSLNSLECTSNLGVVFVDPNGRMQANNVTDTPITRSFIPISPETFVGTPPSREGTKGSKYQYTISFYLADSWYEDSVVVVPEDGFNPINDVKPS